MSGPHNATGRLHLSTLRYLIAAAARKLICASSPGNISLILAVVPPKLALLGATHRLLPHPPPGAPPHTIWACFERDNGGTERPETAQKPA